MSTDAWKKENTRAFSFRLINNLDQDLIDWVGSQPNRTDYFRRLIREDMEKQKKAAKRTKKAE